VSTGSTREKKKKRKKKEKNYQIVQNFREKIEKKKRIATKDKAI
jgi:hypothetical protein